MWIWVKKINFVLKGVNLLGLGFFENRELKIKLGDLVEKHNQSGKNQTKKKDSKMKYSLSSWLWIQRGSVRCPQLQYGAPLWEEKPPMWEEKPSPGLDELGFCILCELHYKEEECPLDIIHNQHTPNVQMLKNSRTKKMNCEIRADQFSLHILCCHLIIVYWCPAIKKHATFLFQSDTAALF